MIPTRTLISAAALAAGLVLAGCETVADATEEGVTASLTGSQEVPGPGDPDGSGTAEITVANAESQVCYELDVQGIAPATAAHIHRGTAGVAGPPVVTMEAPTDGSSDGCITVPQNLADEIEANPAVFYVNVHNAEFPEGAIRGQLAP
jgi:CHRD domain